MPDNPRDDLIEILESVSKAQLQALRRLRRSPARGEPPTSGVRSKRMSHISMVHDILRSARGPLHISEILTLIAKRYGVTLDRESVVSALAKRVARKDRFVRAGANTFALLPEEEE
jgi:hypothetical protein